MPTSSSAPIGTNNLRIDEEAAFIWLGSADGVNGDVNGTPANVHRQLGSTRTVARFGCSVSTAGDVNGDGYADVIVGAPFYYGGQSEEGGAWLYLGSTRAERAPANMDEGNTAGRALAGRWPRPATSTATATPT